jgi:UTP--glucose-1-phosphate uridylyltransferase
MKVKKAVITAAGAAQRTLPLQTLVDRDGVSKTVLQIVVEQAVAAGIDEICIVVHPGDQSSYDACAGSNRSRLVFVEQREPLGYGHAVHCARGFTERAPFLHLVGDHLYVSRSARGCAEELVGVATKAACAVSAVQPSRESLLPFYGVVGGRRAKERDDLYVIERVVEKPTPTQAEAELLVAGLRAGHYLCFFGMHVLTPAVMEILDEHVRQAGGRGGVQLSAALNELASRERYLALARLGWRYDVGVKYGLLTAQLALALDGKDRDAVLSRLLELLAQREVERGPT